MIQKLPLPTHPPMALRIPTGITRQQHAVHERIGGLIEPYQAGSNMNQLNMQKIPPAEVRTPS